MDAGPDVIVLMDQQHRRDVQRIGAVQVHGLAAFWLVRSRTIVFVLFAGLLPSERLPAISCEGWLAMDLLNITAWWSQRRLTQALLPSD